MDEEKETGRVEAFSDGVFAVAITLLVLDLKVPPIQYANPNFSLPRELLHQWPTYLAFTTSFLSVLIMWINHHRVFGLIKRVNDRFLVFNGLLLLCVTVIPFSTSLLAAYIRHPQARIAALIYSGTSVFLAICFNLVWKYASQDNRLLASNFDPRLAESITRSYRWGPLLYSTAFLLAYVSIAASVGLCALLALFFALSPPANNSDAGDLN